MPLWSVGKGIVWSWHRGRLYTERSASGKGHRSLHVRCSIPIHDGAFEKVPRGRALVTDKFKVIEVVNLGEDNKHLTDEIFKALIQELQLEGFEKEILVLEPGWDSEAA
jgi:hypothetical protein